MKDFTGWKYYTKDGTTTGELVGIIFVFPDGSTSSKSLTDPEVEAWIASGGLPIPANAA